jgi:hypothetical protein
VETVKVYQIGLGSFGRYGFEKLIGMHKHLKEVNVEFKGLYETDFEKREKAENFAEANDIELETFETVQDMYQRASEEDGKVLVYDAGPSKNHADNIYNSINFNFFHLAEKPPSLTRDEHLKEKRLAKDKDVFWKVDFIERENPVVKKALQLIGDFEIDEVKVFRESTIGVQKILQPVERQGVRGGDILDKMCHEVYVLDFLEENNQSIELELEDAESYYFMPKKIVSDDLMSIYGGKCSEFNGKVATAQTEAHFKAGDTDIQLNSSWLGTSEESREIARSIEEELGHSLIRSKHSVAGGRAFHNEECRFFMIKGERNLLGDMMNNKLFDLDRDEEIRIPNLMHDQLYRVLRKSICKAAGKDVETVTDKEIDVFMNSVFDVREEVVGGNDFYTELEKGKNRVRQLVAVDDKVLENQDSEQITG